MKILRNISIATKFFLVVGILISLLIIISAVGLSSLVGADDDFKRYRSLARQTNAESRVESNMLLTRLFAKNYQIKRSDKNVAGVETRAKNTIAMINEAKELSKDPTRLIMIKSVDSDLNEYLADFNKVTELQAKRDELVIQTLDVVGPQSERDLTELMKKTASDEAGLALRNLLLGRIYVAKFLILNDDASYQRAQSEFRDMKHNLDLLLTVLTGPELISIAEKVESEMETYVSTFTEVHNIILDRNNIRTNKLDRIGPEIADDLETLVLAIKSEQDTLGPTAEQAIDQAVTVTIVVTVISILFGLFAIFIIGREITKEIRDRKRAEQEAAERKQVFMESADPIIIEDLNGIIIDVNEEAINSYGFSREELIEQPIKILMPEDKHTQADEFLFRCRGGETIRNAESLRWNKSREIIPVLLTLSQLKDDAGRVTAIFSLAKDISVQKEAEQALEKERAELEIKVKDRTAEAEAARVNAEELRDEAETATKAKASFLAAMSHEIRTPMNGIIGMVDLLRQSDFSKEHQGMLQTISDSGQSLVTIINDILDFSKIEAGKLELESIPFSVLETVEGSVASLTTLIQEKGLKLLLYVDPKIPQFVTGDPVRIRQIVTNLGSNACKFTESGEVEIRAELIERNDKKKVSVRFRIIDQGIGISEQGQKKLFTAFSQAESSTTRKYGGTGLGLTICQRLTELMQGDITVESTLGKGSEFTVTVPFAPSDKRIVVDKQSDLKGINILLINKNEKEQFICRSYLEHWHAKVDIAKQSDEPVTAMRHYLKEHKQLDLIIVGSDWDRDTQLDMRKQIHTAAEFSGIKTILLIQGLRNQPRLDDPETVTLDVNPLKRIPFISAVSIAIGRASPEVFHNEQIEDLKVDKVALSVEDAIKQNALILVAEDNPTNQDVISRQLNMLGYTCEMAEDGKQALEAWHSEHYFILLTDCHMPEMDGYDLAGAIRKEEKNTGQRAPIIAITANALQGEADRCLAAGMDDYMSKPIDMKELRDKLRRWMPHFTPSAKSSTATPRKKKSVSKKSSAPIDERALKEMFGDDSDMIKEILNDFVQPSLDIIDEMKSAYTKHSANGIKQAAHKLKSSARSVGANDLANLCTALETAGKDDDWNNIENNVPSIDGLMNAVENYINKL
jgi:PAS domain S-box-containing protein